jgi:CHAT domain-containing protein
MTPEVAYAMLGLAAKSHDEALAALAADEQLWLKPLDAADEESYQRAAEQGDAYAAARLGQLSSAQGEIAKAIEWFRLAAGQAYRNSRTYFIATALLEINEEKLALTNAESLEQHPRDPRDQGEQMESYLPPTVLNRQQDPLVRMQELVALQQETTAALFALLGGGDRPPNEAFERYLGLARRLVAHAADFEADSPGSVDVAGSAQPLVQWLSMYADHRQDDGDAEVAKRLRQEADELTVAYLGPAATAKVHRDRAMQAAMEGRFNDALSGLDDARTTFADAGMILDKVQTDLQLAGVYEWLGDYDRALKTLKTSHDEVAPQLAAGSPSTAQVAAALGRQIAGVIQGGENTNEGENLFALQRIAFEVIQGEARNNRYLGMYDEATRLFHEAQALAADLDIPPAGVDFHLAVIAVARGDAATAQRLLASIAPAFDSGMFRPRRAALRQVQADLHLLRGEPDQALAAADDGLRDQATYPDLELAWKLQWRRARALVALGKGLEAIEAFGKGMSAADRLRMAPLGYRLDTTFVRDKLPMAHAAVDTALAAGDAFDVVWFIELVKSRALAATISLPRTASANRTPQDAQFDALSQRIDALAFGQYNGTAGAFQERQGLIDERDTLLEQIRIRDPRWRTMTEPADLDVDAIQARLGPTRAALTLQHRTDGDVGRIVAALIDATGVVAGAHDLERETTTAIMKFAKNLSQARFNEFLSDLSTEEGVGVEQLLPPEVIERFVAVDTLIVIPHGVLHLLPWACLTVGSQRLFERCAVGILPNLASLPLLDYGPTTESVALIGAADYSGTNYGVLTESPIEIADVAAIYEDRVVSHPVTGRDTTETAFWALADAAWPSAVLHYSGHGSLEAAEPLASGLVLTGSTLDAAEVLERRLPYDEVVLSACSTAWRPQAARDRYSKGDDLYLSGDDALGLPASFLESGARFLLASIPPVRDKAARAFTVAWHRHRCAGLSPLQAYRRVQLDSFAAQPDGVFAWAGMTAYGCR